MSSSSIETTANFLLLKCGLNPSQKWQSVEWKSPHRQLMTPDEDLFVMVDTTYNVKESFLFLYIRKNSGKAGVFVCSSNAHFWAFDGLEEVLQLSDSEVEQQYAAWLHLNLGEQQPLSSALESTHPRRPLTWSDRASILLNLLTDAPWLLVVIAGLTLLLHGLLLYALFTVSERFFQAAARFSRVAFILTEGEKVRTLAKLKRQLGSSSGGD